MYQTLQAFNDSCAFNASETGSAIAANTSNDRVCAVGGSRPAACGLTDCDSDHLGSCCGATEREDSLHPQGLFGARLVFEHLSSSFEEDDVSVSAKSPVCKIDGSNDSGSKIPCLQSCMLTMYTRIHTQRGSETDHRQNMHTHTYIHT